MRKLFSGIVLAILLASTLTVAFNVQTVDAVGTIYIRADGSIDPPDAPILTVDNVTYTLTDNIPSSGDGIIVERNNMVIDGAGYTVTGSGSGNGATLSGRSNVTVSNMTMENFGYGIWLNSSSNNTLSGNNVRANNYAGIKFYSSSYNSISGNHITNNWDGIELWGSSYNSIVGDNVTANINCGILLYISSNNNAIFGNDITANKYGIYLGYSPNFNNIYHNNFIDNAYQIYDFSWEGFGEPSINVWDDGYPSGGNYWSDYNGTDANQDGIGDTPYVIDANNTDHYPLLIPYVIPEFPSLTVVYGSTPTIDGLINVHEWSDATSRSFNNTEVFIKQDGENIYIALNVTDAPLMRIEEDGVQILLDVGFDRNLTLQTDDVGLGVYRNGTLFEANVTGGTWSLKKVSGWTAVVNSTSFMWQVEFNITYSKVNVVAGVYKDIGVSIGCALYPEEGSPTWVCWPPNTYSDMTWNPSSWGAITSIGYNWIPEFTSFPILLLLMIATLLTVIIYRREHSVD